MKAAAPMDLPATAPVLLRPRTSRWPGLWAGLLAAGWFGFWALALQPEIVKVPARQPVKAPRVCYLPGPEARGEKAANADLRAMWSPVLFSLPTPMGFSRSVESGDAALRPPLQQTQSAPVLLARPATADNTPLVPSPTGVLARRAAGEPLLVIKEPPVFAGVAAATGPTWQVVTGGGRAAARWQAQPLPKTPADGGESLWEAGAQVEVSREGVVQHVWLETPTASSNLNVQLVHALLQWRCAPAAAPRTGNVLVRYAGAVAARPPAAGGQP
ncbi:MAG: hypothetical protein NTV49_15645 [Kiritimatiellaeota bacterium]|nr:hypothetical protein [Kiritimatiellota bacterium]